MKKKYSGIVIPAITPLNDDLSLDHAAVEKIFTSFYQHEAEPFILGTTGEAPSLPAALKHDYIRLAVKLKKAGSALYVGISSNCLQESIDHAKRCFDEGVDVVVATLPSYYMLSEDQMKKYFEDLANAISGPLIIYNIPATTHMSIPVKLIDELSHLPNIVGSKDSERSDDRLTQSFALWSGREDFSYFVGWAAKSVEALKNGSGIIPSTGNLFPAVYSRMLKAVTAGENADAFQTLSDTLGNIYQQGRTLGESLWALKYLMSKYELCKPNVMPPLKALSDDKRKKLDEALNQMSDVLKTSDIF